MINKLLDDIKNQSTTVTGWVMGFIGILFVRFILESLSSPTLSGIIPSDPYTLVHYGMYFITVTLGTILIFGFFINDYKYSSKIILFGLPLIWLAPIIDIILSYGSGFRMMYVFDNGKNLIFDFLTFFGPNFTSGATIGIRIGIALSILGIGFLIWKETKNIYKTFFASFLIYTFVFFVAITPSFIYTLTHINETPVSSAEIVSYLENKILSSNISHNTLREGIDSVSSFRFIELGFNKLMTQVFLIISSLLGLLLFYKIESKKFYSIFKNIRIERVNFYTASLFCGIGFAYISMLGKSFVWVDVFGILCLTIAWMFLWLHAVHLNDIYDINIDKISNTDRPLIKEDVSISEMKDLGNIWLGIGLLGAWSAGFYPFFMALVYLGASYIYSVPPLRLRRFPIIPSFLIGIACLATILAGFFFVSVEKQILIFPIYLSVGIILLVAMAINFKDIKDVEGDRANGIQTIPVLFPKHGVKIVAILFSLSMLLVPVFLLFPLLFIISIPASIIGYKIITKKPYNEKNVFILRFFFLGGIAISYILLFWWSNVHNLL